MITPLHWIFFDDQCIFTMFTKKVDGSTENPKSFSEYYMGWFYKPIADSIGWSWDETGISKTVNLFYKFDIAGNYLFLLVGRINLIFLLLYFNMKLKVKYFSITCFYIKYFQLLLWTRKI